MHIILRTLSGRSSAHKQLAIVARCGFVARYSARKRKPQTLRWQERGGRERASASAITIRPWRRQKQPSKSGWVQPPRRSNSQLQPSLEPVSHHTHQCDSLRSQTRPGELIRVSSRPAPALPYRRYPAQHPSAQCTSRPTVSSTGHSRRLAAMSDEPTLDT